MPYFHLLPFVNNKHYGEGEISQAVVFVYLFSFFFTYSFSSGSLSSMIEDVRVIIVKHIGENELCRSTVDLAFRRLQPKITKILKIKQGTNNEGKWKEARYRQVKQWLIMIGRLPEEKE